MIFRIALLFLLACATPKSAEAPTPLKRACDACRANLDSCQRRPATDYGNSPCMDEFEACLRASSLNGGQCAGAN